jgi:hypothetical protein
MLNPTPIPDPVPFAAAVSLRDIIDALNGSTCGRAQRGNIPREAQARPFAKDDTRDGVVLREGIIFTWKEPART